MKLFTSAHEREVIATVTFLPAISIIIPFAPVITLKKSLEHNLKNVLSKVEAVLTTHYTAEKAIPVILKLRNLLSGLNYSTHKKSIAIFVSPVVEKVYYFGIEMEEKIVIDPSFTISDAACCKKEKKEYLILQLDNTFSKMYAGNGTHLTLIKSNKINGDAGNENDIAKFLLQMDRDLSIILEYYRLPVIVIGQENLLNHFKNITENDASLVNFILGNYDEASEMQLCSLMQHFILRWKKFRQCYLLKQIEKAVIENKLKTGVQETLISCARNKGKLLVIEKNFINRSQTSKAYRSFFKTEYINNEAFFIKDEVDDIIKYVLENGGNVEFVDKGILKDYNHIALIEK